MVKKSDLKAEQYFKDKKVFPLVNNNGYIIYLVEAKTGNWQVTQDKFTEKVSCTCKNIRTQFDCSHMKAVLKYVEDKNKKATSKQHSYAQKKIPKKRI